MSDQISGEQVSMPVVPITVTIDASGNITCSPDPVPVVIGSGNALCLFHIVTPGYKYPSSGSITMDTPNPNFPYLSYNSAPTVANIIDACVSTGDYAYTINVVSTTTGETFSHDPVIRNTNAQL